MNAAAHDIDLSVIVTMMDDRGRFDECLSSWTRGQTYPRQRYEVIVVGSGREPVAEATARTLVTAGDRLLTLESRNEIALFDLGAQQARGRWLLFTEAHCAAEPSCIAELIAYLAAHDGQYQGACIRSATDGSSDPIAVIERRWYQDGFSAWSREGDWRKFTIRGTAVHRDAYAGVGGFRSAFGCFAEIILAAELHAGGYRLGYAPAAAVKHYNTTTLHDSLAYVREYRAGEVAFRDSDDAKRLADYFGWPKAEPASSAADRWRAFKRAARNLLGATVGRHRPGDAVPARTALKRFAGATLDLICFGRARLLRAAVGYAWARLQFALPSFDPEQGYRRFCRLWERAGLFATERALARQRRHGPRSLQRDRALGRNPQ